jgi:hypothetical protein
MRQSIVRVRRSNHWSASGQLSSPTQSARPGARLCDAHTLSTASLPFNTGFAHKTALPPLDEQAVPQWCPFANSPLSIQACSKISSILSNGGRLTFRRRYWDFRGGFDNAGKNRGGTARGSCRPYRAADRVSFPGPAWEVMAWAFLSTDVDRSLVRHNRQRRALPAAGERVSQLDHAGRDAGADRGGRFQGGTRTLPSLRFTCLPMGS